MISRMSFISFLAAATLAVQAAGQESKEPTRYYLLDEIVVTATRIKRPVKELASSVSVVTKEDIESAIARTYPDLISGLPGVFIERTGQFGRSDIDIRGLGDRGTKILVLIDGRPEKMSLFGCTVTHTLPLNNVERVEVIRGPSPVIYGSDAFGGVVNIITHRQSPGFSGDLQVNYGSFGTTGYRLRTGAANGSFSSYLTIDHDKSDGHLPNSAYTANDFTYLGSYRFSDRLALDFEGKYYDGRKEEPSPSPPDTWNRYKRGAVDATIRGNWSAWNFTGKLYRDFGHHTFSDGWHSKDHVDGGMVQFNSNHFANNVVSMGADFRRYYGRRLNEPAGSWHKAEFGVWATDEHRTGFGLTLNPGLRWNNDSVAGSIISPQLGLVQELGEHTFLRAMVNRGFRYPQLSQLYLFPPSNPDLKPETVLNREIGLKSRPLPNLGFDLALFWMTGKNLIQAAPNPSPPPKFLFQNVGDFKFKGLELAVDLEPVKRLTTRFSLSYLDPGDKTLGRPGIKADAMARYTLKRTVSLAVGGQHVGRYYAANDRKEKIPDYHIFWTKLIWRFNPHSDVILGIENLFDKKYDVYANLPGGAAGLYRMPGRSFTVGLNLHR